MGAVFCRGWGSENGREASVRIRVNAKRSRVAGVFSSDCAIRKDAVTDRRLIL